MCKLPLNFIIHFFKYNNFTFSVFFRPAPFSSLSSTPYISVAKLYLQSKHVSKNICDLKKNQYIFYDNQLGGKFEGSLI